MGTCFILNLFSAFARLCVEETVFVTNINEEGPLFMIRYKARSFTIHFVVCFYFNTFLKLFLKGVCKVGNIEYKG